MSENKALRNAVVPAMRYRRAPEAIEWLCDVFGFQKHAVYARPDGIVEHAELVLDGGMIMLGSERDNEASQFMTLPSDTNGKETRTVYLISDRTAELYQRAKEAGAEIVRELRTESYGGEGFTCRDPEGHSWSVGSYDPWVKRQ